MSDLITDNDFNFQNNPFRQLVIPSEVESNCTSDMISIKDLRSCPGFEKISDKEASETIISLCQLSQMAIHVITEEQNSSSSKPDNKQDDSG